jgi:hypothetical protein
MQHAHDLKQVTARIGQQTNRPYEENGFNNTEHARQFFAKEGFDVKTYSRSDLGYSLVALKKVGFEADVAKQLDERLKQRVNVWVLSVKQA